MDNNGVNTGLLSHYSMARPSNTSEMVSMSVSLTRQMAGYLEDLAIEGTYGGGNPQDVVKYLLNTMINQLFEKGALERKKYKATPDGKVVLAEGIKN